MDQSDILRFWAEELERPRNRDPKRLLRYGRKCYSQNDEDGIIAEIFRRIGVEGKTFIEFGVEFGGECNTLWLLYQGWSGLWLEGSADYVERMNATHRLWLADESLRIVNSFIDRDNIDRLIAENYGHDTCDLLSIDIDSNDFWVWRAIEAVRPRVVVIEYNATWAPPAAFTIAYAPGAVWNKSNYFGASLEALRRLGQHKGYHLVGCNFSGANAFFVREDLCGDHFILSQDAAEHYEPPRYFFTQLSAGHPPGIGPVVVIPEDMRLE